ncbi:ABC transporter permease [Companilactobacillus sp.]|jgi:oligopeptide transport system permease protein|uniref:ABC transporter permease n=1 Tax=Companilactobacillus sp. TaxID=2767905 RepID=UPI0025C477C5|nr:ABC transporter permease [Companilactobacillus sp.]MCH4009535.1 ABC transporter permease [Companilactobacillus sp.]MCH4052789.1 ABC transporter permease [Companilactobacillus sp.]MCH4077477.1 ABC transporter permease [Companilactobacillus sp.]MCH4126053.1 ABC transporter permease [Companilactobacillus sp.]MCI1311761.1 ABC transporter permease [Companilactobacillus sp.]
MEQAPKIPKEKFKLLHHEDNQEQESLGTPSLTYLQDVRRRLFSNKVATVCLWLLGIIVLISIFAPIVAPHNPNAQQVQYSNLPPKLGNLDIPGFNGMQNMGGKVVDAYKAVGAPKGTYYILGTDYLGRDLLSRIIYGTRLSLVVAVLATLVDLIIGLPYGIVSGWKGGKVDTFLQRIIEIVSSIPNLIVVILMMIILKPGLTSIVIAIALTDWVTMARLIRAQTFQLKEQEYVLAARTLGESSTKIATKHLIPNLSSTIIIQTMFTIPNAIFFEAFLSFIGIGIPAPNASLGTLLSDGQKAFRFLPYQMWAPAIILSIIMIATNLLGDGLRDAFDPQSSD